MEKQKCKKCGAEYSAYLTYCPNCHYSANQQEYTNDEISSDARDTSYFFKTNMKAEKVLIVCCTIVYVLAWISLAISILGISLAIFFNLFSMEEDQKGFVAGLFTIFGGWAFLKFLFASLGLFISWATLRLFVNISVNLHIINEKMN